MRSMPFPGTWLGLAMVGCSALPALAGDEAATPKPPEPFAFADFTWLNGNPRTKDAILDTKYFTGEFRADANLVYDFNHPQDGGGLEP